MGKNSYNGRNGIVGKIGEEKTPATNFIEGALQWGKCSHDPSVGEHETGLEFGAQTNAHTAAVIGAVESVRIGIREVVGECSVEIISEFEGGPDVEI